MTKHTWIRMIMAAFILIVIVVAISGQASHDASDIQIVVLKDDEWPNIAAVYGFEELYQPSSNFPIAYDSEIALSLANAYLFSLQSYSLIDQRFEPKLAVYDSSQSIWFIRLYDVEGGFPSLDGKTYTLAISAETGAFLGYK